MSSAQRWLVPEQVQTSAMDCGPAALTALLAGHGIQASYGRLREACQTSVDGTSIDTIEDVAVTLGLDAEQVMLPIDFLEREEAAAFPALIVTTLPTGATHFILIWNRLGPWIQIMDPGVGRRWVRWSDLANEIYLHQMPVPAALWRDWASGEEPRTVWRRALAELGVDSADATHLIDQATAIHTWYGIATLDAAIRLVNALVRADGLSRGSEAREFITTCLAQVGHAQPLPLDLIPPQYWFARPIPATPAHEEQEELLLIKGAVLVRVRGLRPAEATPPELSPELAAALREPQPEPERLLLQMLGRDGWLPPGLLMLATIATAAGFTVEALLLQGIMKAGSPLLQGEQRITTLFVMIIFLIALALVNLLSIALTHLLGRRLELRLRTTLLEKISRLGSHYFHSRLVSDMAGRAHGLSMLRDIPSVIINVVQNSTQLLLTTAGLIWISPSGASAAIMLNLLLILLLIGLNGSMIERRQRVRAHTNALRQLFLDTLLGLVPLRLHGAERSVQREHEQRLTTWWQSSSSLIRLNILAQAGASLIYVLFAVAQVMMFLESGGPSDRVLLLLFWTMSLPGYALSLIGQIQLYPELRSRLLTLIEPLGAPDELGSDSGTLLMNEPPPTSQGVAIDLQQVTVQAGGHVILHEIDLHIAPGEQIAVVGPSGAGKSSLAGVLLGWHIPSAGSCQVDGRPLTGAAIHALRRVTAWVDPAVQLWNRSLMANLNYGHPDGVIDSLVIEQADLLDLLERLPQGIHTRLGEGGGLVSGGEGQRVRLGRAFTQSEPRLVLLDEPFRGLDRSQRANLLARSRARWPEATMICITHDVSETLNFPRVLVIEEGQIVEDDSPENLAVTNSRYRALLDAEERTRRETWSSTLWRRLRLSAGTLIELPTKSNGEEP